MTIQNPARTSVHPSGGERVQPDGPLSGAVKREGILRQLDQALMDLRHARAALDGAQNRSDQEYAAAVVDTHTRRVAALRAEERKCRR